MLIRILLCLTCLLVFGCENIQLFEPEKRITGTVLNFFNNQGDYSNACGFRVRLGESLEYIHFLSRSGSNYDKYYACSFLKENDQILIVQTGNTYKWKTGTTFYLFQ